jgi:hypothetical protein
MRCVRRALCGAAPRYQGRVAFGDHGLAAVTLDIEPPGTGAAPSGAGPKDALPPLARAAINVVWDSRKVHGSRRVGVVEAAVTPGEPEEAQSPQAADRVAARGAGDGRDPSRAGGRLVAGHGVRRRNRNPHEPHRWGEAPVGELPKATKAGRPMIIPDANSRQPPPQPGGGPAPVYKATMTVDLGVGELSTGLGVTIG